ncbi:hypothetical protein SEA_ANDRIS_83 [Streptomyces phage Andris]|nr:hypothetical protein SEA_ANDRIS_83 [Streptomyces phage Andris]
MANSGSPAQQPSEVQVAQPEASVILSLQRKAERPSAHRLGSWPGGLTRHLVSELGDPKGSGLGEGHLGVPGSALAGHSPTSWTG